METNLDSLFAKWDERREFDGHHNGYAYIDLGLPSGTKWATCNVGADKTEDDGLLFQFGCTDGYNYSDKNNKFLTARESKKATGSNYINPSSTGNEYNKGQKLKLEDDAAHVNMGGKWIMPTKADLQELCDNTTRQVVTIKGKKGMLFTSKLNDKSIFVVFAGYWDCDDGRFYNSGSDGCLRSSEIYSSDAITAWCIGFNSIGGCGIDYGPRADGYSVRGVLK